MPRALREIADHWPILAGLVALGIWAGSLQSQVSYLDQNTTTPVRAIGRQLDSLIIETRHLTDAVRQLRADVRPSGLPPRSIP